MGEEDLKKKFEQYQEDMLKNAAVTFSMEGLSKDVKFFLQRKINYNLECQKNVTELVKAVTSCTDPVVRSSLLKDGSVVKSMLIYNYGEMRLTDMMLNMLIQKIFEKEVAIQIGDEDNTKAQDKRAPRKVTTKPPKE